MAYTSASLACIAGTMRGDQNLWIYRTADAINTVIGSGYFSDGVLRKMQLGDPIMVVKTDTGVVYPAYVSAVSGDAATAAQAPGSPDVNNDETLRYLKTTGHVGAVHTAATTSAVEYGDGYRHTTVLTLTNFAIGTSGDNASKAIGAILYDLPAGAVIVDSSYMSIAVTLADAVQTDTPEIGLGTAVGVGVQATLGAVGATAENIWEGAAVTDCTGATPTVGTKLPTASGNPPLIIETGGAHTIYLNAADGWADLTAGSALTATGTVVLNWRFVN